VTTASVLLGVLDGLLIGLLGVGIVLVYRSSRFLNLAHGQLGALPALLLAKFALDLGWSYWVALVACVAVGAGTAFAVERLLVARLQARSASAVSCLLLTVGVTQVLIALTLVPAFQPDITKLGGGYPLPVRTTFEFGGVVFGGQYVAVLVACPLLVAILFVFMQYSRFGKMIRAAASNPDAARLCGISPSLVKGVTWAIAGGLSAFSAILIAPSQPLAGASLGSEQLFLALGAAAFGGFVSLPWALGGGIAIGVAQQLATAQTSDAGVAKVVVFVLILGVILARSRTIAAVFATDGAAIDDRPPTSVPPRIRDRFTARRSRVLLGAMFGVVAFIAPFLPALSGEGDRFKLSLILLYAVIGVSLTLLIGWAGQLSLGHFAVVGVGAYVATRLGSDSHSMLQLFAIAGAIGALLMVVIGLPALRIRGLTLAVATLGFAVVSSDWLFNSRWFTDSKTASVAVAPMALVRGIGPFKTQLPMYWVCLGVLAVVALATSALRRSNPGRLMIAVRDDERSSAAYGVTPTTVKLTALALSGFIAGMAGVLWAATWGSVSAPQFPPDLSLSILAVPVIGGVGSIAGAVAGATVLYAPAFFLSPLLENILGPNTAQLITQFATGGVGLILVLLVYPTGLAGATQRMWERFLEEVDRYLARQAVQGDVPALEVDDVALHFGGVKALRGASIRVAPGEIVGLIGANGAGKSTLLNVVSGVLQPDNGSVRLHGRDVTRLAPELRASLGMGRSFQSAHLFPGLTVRETVQTMLGARERIGTLSSMIGAPWASRAERRTRDAAGDLVERMGLAAFADTLTSDLSTGTRRICDLTVQVAGRPSVLLLDEPTAGVAQREAEAFGPLLRRIRDELDCSIVIVEHDMPLLMGLCDRVYALELGEVIADGTPEAVRHDPRVIAGYLGTDETAIARSGAKAKVRTTRRREPLRAHTNGDASSATAGNGTRGGPRTGPTAPTTRAAKGSSKR
jgi:ABC-type branched-subunit amino acid transport system ATPase component/ABC-type branched-subunit amino acid transport system permease subunit